MSDAAPTLKIYFRVFISLLALLFITVGVAFIPTGNHPGLLTLLTVIGFLIAGTKALLIILWFMHVKAASRVTWIFAGAGFVWLFIMFALTFNDYGARDEISNNNLGPNQGSTAHAEYRPVHQVKSAP
jgi:cytochrome c oxidase subunit 4